MTNIRERLLQMLRFIHNHHDYETIAHKIGYRSHASIADFLSGRVMTMKMEQATATFDLYYELQNVEKPTIETAIKPIHLPKV